MRWFIGAFEEIIGRTGVAKPVHELNGNHGPVPFEHPGHQARRDGVITLHFLRQHLIKLARAHLRSFRNAFEGWVCHVRNVRGPAQHSGNATGAIFGKVMNEFGVGFVEIFIPHSAQINKFGAVHEFVK